MSRHGEEGQVDSRFGPVERQSGRHGRLLQWMRQCDVAEEGEVGQDRIGRFESAGGGLLPLIERRGRKR